MSKYGPMYKDEMSRMVHAAMNGIPLEDLGIKITPQLRKYFNGLKREIETIRESGQGIVLPN